MATPDQLKDCVLVAIFKVKSNLSFSDSYHLLSVKLSNGAFSLNLPLSLHVPMCSLVLKKECEPVQALAC